MADKIENDLANRGAIPPDDDDMKILDDDKLIIEDEDEEEEEKEEEKKPSKKKVEEKDEEEEEEEDKDEDEDEEEEEKEKKKDLPFSRPTLRDIKTKYPDLFKDFPSLRDSFFREQEYSRLFATVEDAKEAFEDSEAFSTLHDSVMNGDSKPLMDSIAGSDKDALVKFATSFLPILYERDTALYSKTVTPLMENVARSMYKKGINMSDEDVSNAALQLSMFLFDTPDVATGKTTVVEDQPTKRDSKLDAERTAFEAQKFQTFRSDVISDIDRGVDELISDNIDPDNVLNKFTLKKVVEEVRTRVGDLLEKDESHMVVMNSRWTRAQREGFKKDSGSKIVSAYLARAKSLIPRIRNKVVEEAIGHTSSKNGRDQDKRQRREVRVGGVPSKSRVSARDIDWSNTSDLDILEGNIKTRR